MRPNSGRVEPGQSVEVQGKSCASLTRATYLTRAVRCVAGWSVMLQAMKEEPGLAAKCKDKFLIQSTTITPEKETLSLADIVSSSSLPLLAGCHLFLTPKFLPRLVQRFYLRDDDIVEHQRR